MSEQGKVFAEQGEKVTCENGHHICDVAADLLEGETINPNQFNNWAIPIPVSGQEVKPCQCGANYIRTNPDNPSGTQVFIGRWRPVWISE